MRCFFVCLFSCFCFLVLSESLSWILTVKVTKRPADTRDVPHLRPWGWAPGRFPLQQQFKRGKYKISFVTKLGHDLNLCDFKSLIRQNEGFNSQQICCFMNTHLMWKYVLHFVLLVWLQQKQQFGLKEFNENELKMSRKSFQKFNHSGCMQVWL